MPIPKPDNQAPAPHPLWSSFWDTVYSIAQEVRAREREGLCAAGMGEEAEEPETDKPPVPGKAQRASH